MIGSKAKLALLGVLVVFAACAGVSSTASASNLGPFWHVEGKKLGQGLSKAITDKLAQPKSTALYTEIGNLKVRIICEAAPSKGAIWNGTSQGEDEDTIEFKTGCKVEIITQTESKIAVGCKVKEPIIAETRGGLWYHTKSLKVSPFTEKTKEIQAVFNPTQAKGTFFTEVTITGCEEEAINIAGAKVTGSVAGAVKPEREETKEGTLFFPTEQQSHVWRPTSQQSVESQLELKFAGKGAKLQGEAVVVLAGGGTFGVFDE